MVRISLLASAVVAAGLLSVISCVPLVAQRHVAILPYSSAAKGAKWVYSDGVSEETIAVTDVIETEPGARKITTCIIDNDSVCVHDYTFIVSSAGIYATRISEVEFTSPLCLLRLPHDPARLNEWEVNVIGRNGRDSRLAGTFKASGPEEVQVPAGKYIAIRVDQTYTYHGSDIFISHWYAPGVGCVKTTAGSRTTVLTAFTPAP